MLKEGSGKETGRQKMSLIVDFMPQVHAKVVYIEFELHRIVT